jgi:hypothetical protein
MSIKINDGGGMSGFLDRNRTVEFIEELKRSKYCDLIILSAVALVYFMLMIISATLA